MRPTCSTTAQLVPKLSERLGRARRIERGLFLGVLIGGGSFGGDGKQPQVTLRMHTRHEDLFRWLERTFPRSKLYGPTHAAPSSRSRTPTA